MCSAKTRTQANEELRAGNNYISIEEILKPKADWKILEKEVSFDIKNIRRELERSFAKLIGVE